MSNRFERSGYVEGDAIDLAYHLRDSDLVYIENVDGRLPGFVLSEWFSEFDRAWTFLLDNEVAGCVALRADNLWMQTNALADRHPRDVVKCVKELAPLLPKTPLQCVVPTNDKRVRMIAKCMGFTKEGALFPDYINSGIDHITLWRPQCGT